MADAAAVQRKLPLKKRKRCYDYHSSDEDEDCRRYERSYIKRGKVRVIGASCSEVIGYKAYKPTTTILVKALPLHLTENGIRQALVKDGVKPKDVRLIRRRSTGQSRRFGFIEFNTVRESVRYMEMRKGIFVSHNGSRSLMQYSHSDKTSNEESQRASDWFCTKCVAQNFRKRERCFKCNASRMESEEGGTGSDEISDYVTKTIMIRNLDPLTTVDTVREVLSGVIFDLMDKITTMLISVDSVTSTSRGICYLAIDNLINSISIYNALTILFPGLSIDDRKVSISYCKYNLGDSADLYEGQEETVHADVLSDKERFARFYAEKYAKASDELEYYLTYFRNYYTQQMYQQNILTQCSIQPSQLPEDIPDGTDGKQYPTPDISTYIYDETIGRFYDQQTGLYYDKNSMYYWNNQIRKYLYWDSEKLTYVLAEENTEYQEDTAINEDDEDPMFEEELRQVTGILESSEETSSSDECSITTESRFTLPPVYSEIHSEPKEIVDAPSTSAASISPDYVRNDVFRMIWKSSKADQVVTNIIDPRIRSRTVGTTHQLPRGSL